MNEPSIVVNNKLFVNIPGISNIADPSNINPADAPTIMNISSRRSCTSASSFFVATFNAPIVANINEPRETANNIDPTINPG